MAEKTINNPSLLPDDLPSLLDIQLSGNNIIAISGHPVAGSGGGTQSDFVYYPVFDDTTGNVEFHLGTTASNPQPAGGWHISGADGATGPRGEPGDNGKTPTFQINPENAHWEWKYTDDVAWTDTYVVASGAIGPKGEPGAKGDTGPQGTKGDKGDTGATGSQGEKGDKGDNGVSPTVSTSVIEGGNRVTFTYGAGSSTYIDVMNGASGASGASGYSPTVTTSEISPTTQHPQGGTSVTITDSVGAHQFDVWNGLNGEGATVNLLEGTGIQITENGTDYTIGVSADYALKSELPDVTDMATETWVRQQGYLTSIPNTYALKTDVEAASANALSEAEAWVGQQGYLKSVPESYATKTYANEASANAYDKAVAKIPDVTDFITKDVDDLTYYYKKTETSSTSEISNALTEKVNLPTSQQTGKLVYNATNNTWEAAPSEFDGVVTAGSLSGNGTTNSPLGLKTSAEQALAAVGGKVNPASYDDDCDYSVWKYSNQVSEPSGWYSLRKAGVDMGWIKPEELSYWIKPKNGISAEWVGEDTQEFHIGIDTTNMTANKQYAFTTIGWAEVSVPTIPDITANNGLSANGHTVGISTTNIDANKQYAWTTTGWQLVSVPTIPDITAHNGLSADGHTVGIDDTNIAANTQYAWTTSGWKEVDGYLSTAGGTVSGQLITSATRGTFDDSYLKCINDGNDGFARFGVGRYGGAVIKAVDGSNNPVQVNVKYNANNNELIQVQKSNADVGYLIPAKIEQAGWSPSTDDKILHIVLES